MLCLATSPVGAAFQQFLPPAWPHMQLSPHPTKAHSVPLWLCGKSSFHTESIWSEISLLPLQLSAPADTLPICEGCFGFTFVVLML